VKVTPIIETERLVLRPFRRRDAAAASYNSRQPSVAHFMSDMVLPTKKDAKRWIRWIYREVTVSGVLAVTLKSSKKCIGLVGAVRQSKVDNEIEILFAIADEYQNNGYAAEAGSALIDWVFANTEVPYLVAIVKHENLASQRVIAKLGFAYSGERRAEYDGEMTDFHYYRLNRPDAQC